MIKDNYEDIQKQKHDMRRKINLKEIGSQKETFIEVRPISSISKFKTEIRPPDPISQKKTFT